MENKAEIQEFVKSNLRKFKEYLQPHIHILENPYLVDRETLVSYLQNKIRAALVYFVNGCYWFAFTKWDLFFPFYTKVESRIKQIFFEMKPILGIATTKFNYFNEFYSKLNEISKISFVSEEAIAILFSTFYREFENILLDLNFEKEATKDICAELKIDDYPIDNLHYPELLSQLKSYSKRYLQEYLVGFYLHGSLSTMDYIPYWSDVDTLMIVKKETILNPKSLLRLRKFAINSHKYFYQIDPHQLHGHFLISEFDLAYYPQTYFPIVLFKYSKSFFKNDQPLSFRLRDYRRERIAAFWNDAISYFLLLDLKSRKTRSYSMANRETKLFFHRLLTFPLFYLQAKGIHVYKKYSFEKAKNDFEDNLWEIIKTATEIRSLWKFQYKANRFLRFIIFFNPKFFLLAVNKYYDFKYRFFDGAFSEFNINYEKWLSQAIDLSVIAWNKIIGAKC